MLCFLTGFLLTPGLLQEWASPADQVLALKRIRGDKHATIAAMHRAVDSVSIQSGSWACCCKSSC